jgi:hypothetical protein
MIQHPDCFLNILQTAIKINNFKNRFKLGWLHII